MDSKYLDFVELAPKPKTKVWLVQSKSDEFGLGEIKWYANWRQYCFFPTNDSVWSVGCLEDIKRFISEANETRHKRVT